MGLIDGIPCAFAIVFAIITLPFFLLKRRLRWNE